MRIQNSAGRTVTHTMTLDSSRPFFTNFEQTLILRPSNSYPECFQLEICACVNKEKKVRVFGGTLFLFTKKYLETNQMYISRLDTVHGALAENYIAMKANEQEKTQHRRASQSI